MVECDCIHFPLPTLVSDFQASCLGIRYLGCSHFCSAGTNMKLNNPSSMVLSHDDSTLFVAEMDAHKIRMIDMSTAVSSTLCGSVAGMCCCSALAHFWCGHLELFC